MTTKYHYLLGRLCYSGSIFEAYIPEKDPRAKPVWTAAILMKKDEAAKDPAFAAFKADIIATGKRAFGDRALRENGAPAFEVNVLKDGDLEEQDWMADHWVIKTKTKFGAPKVLGPDNNQILAESPEAEKLVYAGQNVLLRLKLYDYTFMREEGVSGGLQGIKIIGGGKKVSTEGSNVADGLAANTPEDLPASMQYTPEEEDEMPEATDAGAEAAAAPRGTKGALPGETIPW